MSYTVYLRDCVGVSVDTARILLWIIHYVEHLEAKASNQLAKLACQLARR